MRIGFLLGASFLVALSGPALADEQTQVTAQSGNWMAMTHSPSETDPPDLCLAFNPLSKVALRSDGNTVSFRIVDDSWSLPSSVEGNIVVTIGSDIRTLTITSNTSTAVDADIVATDVPAILNEMAKASAMEMAVGKSKPFSVSLSGSTAVLNSFRTCAGIGGSAPGGGSNPFQ